MQVLLLEAVPNLGNPGDLVQVKPGFARNFLVPRGKALVASAKNVRQFEHQKRIAERRRVKFLEEIRSVADRLNNARLNFDMRVGPQGKLFGSVTNRMIAEQLSNELDLTIDRSGIQLDRALRETGEFVVEVRLDREVSARVKVQVTGIVDESAAEEEEPAVDETPEDNTEDSAADTAESEDEEGGEE